MESSDIGQSVRAIDRAGRTIGVRAIWGGDTAMTRSLSHRYLLWFGSVTLMAFAGLLFSTAGPFRVVEGHGVSSEEANARLWHFRLPADAENVWFKSGYRGTRVECELGRTEFGYWCESEDWKTTAIDDRQTEWVISMRLKSSVEVRNGLQFSDLEGDVGYKVIFDADTQTVYVSFSGG